MDSSRAADERFARELPVLDDLARRLATLHDSGSVLSEVTAQSRTLLGVDVAFILLPATSATGEEFIRIDVVSGTHSAALRGVMLRRGEGIAGRVLETGAPLWSESYLHDQRLLRVASVDFAAEAERLEAIVAVPLISGEEIVGVLCAADRRPRTFDAHDIDLLSRLAAHAAIALTNARVFETNVTMMAALEASNAALASSVADAAALTALQADLARIVLDGGTVSTVISTLSRAVSADVVFFDAEGAGRVGNSTLTSAAFLDAAGSTPGRWEGEALRPHELGSAAGGHFVVPLVVRGGCAGCVLAPLPLTDAERHLLEIGATTVGMLTVAERAIAAAHHRTREDAFRLLLSGTTEPARVAHELRGAGFPLDSPGTVLVLAGPATQREDTAAEVRRRLDDVEAWWVDNDGRSVAWTARDLAVVLAASRAAVQESSRVSVGAAAADAGVHACTAAFRRASRAAGMLLALGSAGRVIDAAQTELHWSVLESVDPATLRDFTESILGPLRALPTERRRQLIRTVHAFLANSQRHAATCAALDIHTNTLYQRLDRLDELLGSDWRSAHRSLDVALAAQWEMLASAP